MAQKAVDEIFCRSCGEAIKKEAEICPHCGVRNQAGTASSNQQNSSGRSTVQHDPSQYETTVSGSWWYGILVGTLAWTVGFALFAIVSESMPGGILETIMAFALLIGWVIVPIAIFFDSKYVRANSTWNPSSLAYIIASIFWLVNGIAGAVYLYRRHEALGEP